MHTQMFICECCWAVSAQLPGAIVVDKVSTQQLFLTAMVYFDSVLIIAKNHVEVSFGSVECYETHEDMSGGDMSLWVLFERDQYKASVDIREASFYMSSKKCKGLMQIWDSVYD